MEMLKIFIVVLLAFPCHGNDDGKFRHLKENFFSSNGRSFMDVVDFAGQGPLRKRSQADAEASLYDDQKSELPSNDQPMSKKPKQERKLSISSDENSEVIESIIDENAFSQNMSGASQGVSSHGIKSAMNSDHKLNEGRSMNSDEAFELQHIPETNNDSASFFKNSKIIDDGGYITPAADSSIASHGQSQVSAGQELNSIDEHKNVHLKLQNPSASRSRWKKQNKSKLGDGGHWVEYDFDGGAATTTVDPSLPENPAGLKNPNLLVGPWVEEPTVRKSKAYFGGKNDTLVNAQIDTTANLPCVIFNRDDHETVSWIRSRDHHLITVGRQTYSSDNRFSVNFNRHLSQWTLHLRYVQPRDAGEYICQLSTDPPMVYVARLSVTE
ncbi:uncharacterized protein LOC108671214, partial [Hyalella azteca]|uniref:Uncharacterized protein LOC108671214 n=1 Tax=Hyalella azteca TaxID=294128 RepID=A0A8B7NKL1_HYAAZ